MSVVYSYPRKRTKPHEPSIEQLLIALLIGFVLFFVLVAALIAGFQALYIGRIFPGVQVYGIDVGGLSPVKAAAVLSERLTFPQTGHILLVDGERSWNYSPVVMGLFLDPESSAQSAFEIGRTGPISSRFEEQFKALFRGTMMSPKLVFDGRIAQRQLTDLAKQVDLPVVEPSLTVNGTDVQIHPGQIGRTVDVPATLAALQNQLQLMRDGAVTLVMHESQPMIGDVSAQAENARKILSSPLTLRMPESQPEPPGPWTISPEELAPMLTFERVHDGGQPVYRVALNRTRLYTFLAKISPEIQQEPRNARFTFNDDSHQLEVIQPSLVGRKLDVEKSANRVQEQLTQGVHDVQLELILSDPKVNDQMTAEELGVTELVQTDTSYFYGSGPERVQNIQAAAKEFHGLLVAPGETFSMASAMGDISLDNGYAEAMIILGDRTIKGVGGGVCQVSTTFFRTAFFAGFPIVERHAHAYRVYYYEKIAGNVIDPNLAGLDATVFVPLIDFKFTNDTPYWLLMETYVNPTYSSIQWKFYSTRDGRTVDWHTTGPVNVVKAPEPLYRENPDLPGGEVKQVDYAAEGADITVNRTVYKDGNVYLQDTFETHYQPWQAVYEYGPGTEGMPPAEAEGGE